MNRDVKIVAGWIAIAAGLVILNDAYRGKRPPLVARILLPL